MQSGIFPSDWRAALRGLTATVPSEAARSAAPAGTTHVFRPSLTRQINALPWGAWLALAARMFRSDSAHALLTNCAWLELPITDGLIFRFTSLQMPIWAMRTFHPDETLDLVPTLNQTHELPTWRQTPHQRVVQTFKRQFSRKPDAALLNRLQGKPRLHTDARSAVISTLIERGYTPHELGQLANETNTSRAAA